MRRFPPNVHMHVVYTTLAVEHQLPGIFYLDLWPLGPVQIIVTDPDLAAKYTITQNLPKHALEGAFVDKVVGKDNIVASNGQIWKRSHRMLAPAFSESQIKSTVPMFAHEAMIFRKILLQKAEAGKPFLMEEIVTHAVFDIICTAIFGFSLEAQTTESFVLKTFLKIVNAWWEERFAWNPLKMYRRRLTRLISHRKLDNELKKMIRERYDVLVRDSLDLSKTRGLSMLDLLLRERYEEAKDSGKPASKAIDEEYMQLVITNIKTLLLGGSGTSTDTLSFAYMLLSTHPEVVKRLRAEHDRVFSPSIEETYSMLENDPSKLNELELTGNVLKETMRFFPIGHTARAGRTTNDFLEWKGTRYPMRDWMMCPLQHTMQMDPKNFPDPGVFDPDRYARKDFHRLAWRPFERGARACIGQNLAMDEMKVVLLFTMREFDFECHDLKPFEKPAAPWWDMDTVYGDRAYQEFIFEAKPRGGMPMVVRKSGYGTE